MCKLPDCSIPSKVDQVKYVVDENYQDLVKLVEELVGADCWAVVVNGEPIFNSYAEKSHKDRVLDSMYRKQLIENAHSSLLVHINRKDESAEIEIYMFGMPEAFKYAISYRPCHSQNIYSTKIYMSDAYFKKFGDDLK
jgi:hypothetical protein